jgi:hypothetical protein
MSSQSITHALVPESSPSKILKSLPRPNFAAWLVLSVVVFVWHELSPVWVPLALSLISFLAPFFWLLCTIVVVLSGIVLGSFGLALLGLLLGGTIPRSR